MMKYMINGHNLYKTIKKYLYQMKNYDKRIYKKHNNTLIITIKNHKEMIKIKK